MNNEDELLELKENKYVFTDKKIQTSNLKDTERERVINNIKLETNFYNQFKNTFKKILNETRNSVYKKNIYDIITDSNILYYDKINNIYKILYELGNPYFNFAKYNEKVLNKIKNLSMCYNQEDCNTNYCLKVEDKCILIIPDKNLLTNISNEEFYYTKISDEFVRFNNFRDYIFTNKLLMQTNFQNYNLLSYEILIFQSSLIDNYLKINQLTNNNLINNFYIQLNNKTPRI